MQGINVNRMVGYYIFGIILSLIYFIVVFFAKKKTYNQFIKIVLKDTIVFILFIVIMINLFIMYIPEISFYESSFFFISFLLLFCFIISNILERRKITIKNIIYFIFFESLLIALYSILTYGQANVHSDAASAFLLSKSIIKNKCIFPKTWNYANGDIWTFTLWPECLFPTIMINNAPLARALGSVLSILFAVLCIIYMCKTLFKNNCWLIAIPILLIYLFGQNDMILYQACYVQMFPIMSLIITLSYKVFIETNNHKKIHYVILSLLLIVCCMGGIRYIAELSIPLIATPVLYYLLKQIDSRNFNIKKIIVYEIFIALCSIIGYLIYLWLCSWHNMGFSSSSSLIFASSIIDVIKNIGYYFVHFFDAFGFYGQVSALSLFGIANIANIISCLVTCFVVPFFQYRNYRNESESTKIFLCFTVCHNIILFLSIVLFEKQSVSYILTSLFLIVIVSSKFIYDNYNRFNPMLKTIFIFIYLLFSIICFVVVFEFSAGWEKTLENKRNTANRIISLGVSKVYAPFWNAYVNYIYSDAKLESAAIYINKDNGNIDQNVVTIDSQYWLNDSQVFDYIDNIKSGLLLNNEEYYTVCNYVDLINVFGAYEEYLVDDLHLLIFDHDISINLYNGLMDNVIMPSENMFIENGSGVKEPSQIEIFPNGCTSGPYISMKSGKYKVIVNGYNIQDVKLNVFSFTNPKIIETKKINSSLEQAEFEIIIDQDVDNVEFQIYNPLLNKNIYVYNIEVR